MMGVVRTVRYHPIIQALAPFPVGWLLQGHRACLSPVSLWSTVLSHVLTRKKHASSKYYSAGIDGNSIQYQ